MHASSHMPLSSQGVFQDAFAAALLDPFSDGGPLSALVAQPGFAVYRNTVIRGCVDAIVGNYPAVMGAVGEEWMRAAAGRYVRMHPPGDPRLLVYGATFPDFLRDFDPARDMPWLADLARIDRWWTEAHVAADADPLSAAALTRVTPSALGETVFLMHPSARWGWFDDTPAHTLWRLNRDGADEAAFLSVDWKGEGVLVVRPHGIVDSHRLDRGACAFLDACAAGATLSGAAATAHEIDPATNLTTLITTLISAGAFRVG